MSTTNSSSEPATADPRRRRKTILKFSLAAVALLGIGAAATSSAWTDDAWFSATASAASIELEGSLTQGGPYELADVVGAAIVIPPATFANMVPGEERTITLYLHNDSTVALDVPVGTVGATGTLFAGLNPVLVDPGAAPGTMAADAEAPVVLTLTAPDWVSPTDDSYQGATGSLTVQFTGTTQAP